MAIDSIDFNTFSSGLTIVVTPINPLIAPVGEVNYELATVLNNLASSNIDISVNTISATNIDGSILLIPNGTGSVQLGNDLNINGNTLSALNVDGSILLIPNGTGSVQLGNNLNVNGNVISSLDTDGEIRFSPNGTGNIILGNQGSNPPTLDSLANLFNLNSLTAGNLHLEGNTLSSIDVNGNIILAPNGTGSVIIGNSIINPITVNSTGDLYNLRSITVNNVYAINTITNTLKAFTSIETPLLNSGNLRIVDNTLLATNIDGSINLLPNGEGVVLCRGHFDGNNNNFQNINSLTADTLNATSINISSNVVSSPIYRGWIVYNPITNNVLKDFNVDIYRNGPGNYTVNWQNPPPNASYGINVTTGLDSAANANYANITNQNQYSFDIIISTGLDAFVNCTLFY